MTEKLTIPVKQYIKCEKYINKCSTQSLQSKIGDGSVPSVVPKVYRGILKKDETEN